MITLKEPDSDGWITYNTSTHTYDTRDGTKVCAFLVDNVSCLADILHIAKIRYDQRQMIRAAKAKETQ